jgi:hypothetical protein
MPELCSEPETKTVREINDSGYVVAPDETLTNLQARNSR